jgi:hypothetical protein
MDEVVAQLPVVGGVLASVFVGPFCAFCFLLLRKKRARQRRRSPIGIELLRGPGHTLRQQLDELQLDLLSEVYALMSLPLIVLALFLAEAHRRGLDRMRHLVPFFVAIVLIGIVWIIFRLVKAGGKLDNLRNGYDAEVAVGQELDQLMRQGAAVFHDFPADGFNIDHVVIAPRGVFAVETKGYTKRGDMRGKQGATVVFDGNSLSFPHWLSREPIEQAERQAQWLAKWVTSATGEPVGVVPVLALPVGSSIARDAARFACSAAASSATCSSRPVRHP